MPGSRVITFIVKKKHLTSHWRKYSDAPMCSSLIKQLSASEKVPSAPVNDPRSHVTR